MSQSENPLQRPKLFSLISSITSKDRLVLFLLLIILSLAGILRFTGLNWDEHTHTHPDERFLTLVETGLRIPSSLGEYFDTENSTFNPNNVGYGFFVYGTFPVFMVKILGEWFSKTGFDEIHLVGRAASATFDLISVLLVYLIAAKLYRRRVGLLAAAFAASSVLLIQHAHFFVVDSFANTFILLGIFFAIRVIDSGRMLDYAGFGLALGMSVASKISSAPLAMVIVLSAGVRIWQISPENRVDVIRRSFNGLVLAAVISLLTFRILQPYAFQGPSFFGVLPNKEWLADLSEVRQQQSGSVDFPPALQWAKRLPILFSLQNLVVWGLGLPLGLTAWVAWGWALVQMVRGKKWRHTPLVVWTGLFFLWQSIGFTRAMRYQLPIYPTLVILAAWGLWKLWEATQADVQRQRAKQIAVAGLGIFVLGSTALYAFSFLKVYSQTNSQVAASRWIYSHTPGALNLVFEGEGDEILEPAALPTRIALKNDEHQSITIPFHLSGESNLTGLQIILREAEGTELTIHVNVETADRTRHIAESEFSFSGSTRELNFPLEQIPSESVLPEGDYVLLFELVEGEKIEFADPIRLKLVKNEQPGEDTLDLPKIYTLLDGETLTANLTSRTSGLVRSISLPYATSLHSDRYPVEFQVDVHPSSDPDEILSHGTYLGELPPGVETSITVPLETAFEAADDTNYIVQVMLVNGPGIQLRGSRIIGETSWDLGLPLRVDGRDGFAGLYTGLNQELYWDDDADVNRDGTSDKLIRIAGTLTEGDFLVIPTNRVYGTTTRVPERYPLTTAYYRALLGCPSNRQIITCAAQATPEETSGELGYRLIATFSSNPSIDGVEINDQYAEEAFTVYDHPKVLIFAKDDYSETAVLDILGKVETRYVVHAPPNELGGAPDTILISPEEFSEVEEAGTWSDLFNRNGLINRYPLLTIIIWWLMMGLLGLVAFPIVRLAFRGLHDRGYSIARLIGLLLLAWGSWILGSLKIPVSKPVIFLVFLGITSISAWLAWRDRAELIIFFRENKKTILWIEGIALAFFAVDLMIRIGNPDLWHPFKGGEKPMDFSYLNAVLKSETFPPYDPWFAQGYINYYYFGFVLVGMPIKLLGIVPSIAYNLIIPTLFSLVALSAYSVSFNLFLGTLREKIPKINRKARIAGISAAVALVMLGNLGTLRMFYEGFRQAGGWPGESEATFASGPIYALQGVVDVVFGDESLGYRIDNWYWDPSRAIEPGPGEAGPITEFPFFTFLYADLHAHMISLPLTVAILAWVVSWLLGGLGGGDFKRSIPSLFIGALLLGALRPTNTWDFPTFWAIAGIATIAAPWFQERQFTWERLIRSIIGPLVVLGSAYLLYQPYNYWYRQGYTTADLWNGSQTAFGDYLIVHGLFLFMILTWLAWETREWMARTPLRALSKWRQFIGIVLSSAVILLAVIGIVASRGFGGAPVAALVMVWAGILLIRAKLPLGKRIVLFWVGTGAALTVIVEFIVLQGDISRMNTVFKFYLQVWTLFSISAATAMAWIRVDIRRWSAGLRNGWRVAAGLLIFSAILYPATAAPAKMRDRIAEDAPISLDGMAFMPYSTFNDIAGPMTLEEDYEAISWMQENIEGSPVIVEGNTPEYRWGSRFTIYTGLPAVLGWNWHQRQQRGFGEGPSVTDRANDITDFYTTPSASAAVTFLEKYGVNYVVVGALERQYFASVQPCFERDPENISCDLAGWPMGMIVPDVSPAECQAYESPGSGILSCPTHGLEKFADLVQMGVLRIAFRTGETTIYEVML